MGQAISMTSAFEQPAWKNVLNWAASILIAIVFLAAGLFHTLDPFNGAVLMTNLKVPQGVSLPFTVLLGAAEIFIGVLFLIPKYRRWASWSGGFMLLAFMAYIGYFYGDLRGAECSCFPWVKRAVSPAFFAEDGIMLLLAVLAGLWTPLSRGLRIPSIILGAVLIFATGSFVVASAKQSGTRAPGTVAVDGHPYDISTGRVFLFFYDPECMHCLAAGEGMAKLHWADSRVVGVPVVNPQFAPAFMDRTGLKGVTTTDFPSLKKTFNYKAYPFAVTVENGRQTASLTKFENDEPAATLKKLGFVH